MGCQESWIGDKSCDNACNNIYCGYDGFDCGWEKYEDNKLYGKLIDENTFKMTYYADEEINSFFLFTIDVNDTLKEATYEPDGILLCNDREYFQNSVQSK